LAPEYGCDHRYQAVDHEQQREEVCRIDSSVQVAHDGPRDHDAGRSGEALEQPQSHQRPDIGRDHARTRCGGIDSDAYDHRSPSAQLIAEGAGQQLADR